MIGIIFAYLQTIIGLIFTIVIIGLVLYYIIKRVYIMFKTLYLVNKSRRKNVSNKM